MKSSKIIYHSLIKRIQLVRKKEKYIDLVTGVFSFIGINIFSCLLILMINLIFNFSPDGRIVLNGILLTAGLFSLAYFIIRPLFSLVFFTNKPSINSIADRIGKAYPFLRDRLVNTLQLFHFFNQNPEGYSLSLINVALTEINETSKDVDFLTIIDKSGFRRSLKFFIVAIISISFVLILFSSRLQQSAYYLIHPMYSIDIESNFKLKVLPGNIEVLRNSSVDLEAIVEGEAPANISLHTKSINNQYQFEKMLTKNQNGNFHYTIENIKDSTEYFFATDVYSTPKYLISVVELPMVRNIQIKLSYPAYSKIESHYLDENVGDISALKGTLAEIKIVANKRLSEALLNFEKSKDYLLDVKNNTARGKFNIFNTDVYKAILKDNAQRYNDDPIEYRIIMLEDNYPSIKIVEPGKDVDITEEMNLLLNVEGEDDFGFSGLQLAYQIHNQQETDNDQFSFIQLILENFHEEKFNIEYHWNLKNLNLFPEDVVTYYVEVFDNDNISGPKSAKSATYTIRFPSIYEIYSEVQKEQNETFQTFEGMYEQSKELKDQISDLVQQMKKDANLEWEEKKQLEDILNTQRELQQNLEEVEQRLDEMIDHMEKNDLISLETLKKYQEVQQLMQQILSEDIKKAIDELQRAMEQIDPEQLKEVVENLHINQEEFLSSLEKTLEILKRLQIEQKLDEVVKKATELLNGQKELLEKTKIKSQQEGSQFAKEQQDIRSKTDALKKEIEDLQNSMSQFPDMPANQINASLDLMEKEQISGTMQNAGQCFQAGNMSGGQQHGQQAQNSLSELTDMLQNAKKELLQNQKQQVENQLRALSKDLLSLSMSQENVINSTQGLNQTSPLIESIAERQQNLVSGLNRVIDKTAQLSKKTLFVTPEIMRSMVQSLASMHKSLGNLEERNGSSASRNQGNAMVSLNEAIKEIQKSMQNLSSSGSASGMQQLLDRLSQMASQQQGINQQTMQLGMGQQQMSLHQQAAMARLAAEQSALRKSLEQLSQEFGNRSEILGSLDKIAEDMKDVVGDLQSKNIDRKTVDRQRQILSRLLDAQRSIQQRDYSRKRKAETGKEYFTKSPLQLPDNYGEKHLKLREDLLKALKQGYTRDYQDLIKKYFEALVNEKKDN